MKTVLTIGEILVEIMAVERGDGFLQPMPLIGPYPSGAPAIFIDQAARFGQPCAILACVGADDFGRTNLRRLEQSGVDISGVAVHPELPTGTAFVRYRPSGARDFVFNIKASAAGQITLGEDRRCLVERCDHLHIMGTSLFSPAIVDVVLKAAAIVRRKGGTISFDPNVRPEMLFLPGLKAAMETLLTLTDLFLPSGDELFLFSPGCDEATAVRRTLGMGVKAIAVKRGAEGCAYFDTRQQFRQPAFAAREVDPTGAGDCFGAVFVACWLRGQSPKDALRFAAAAGARAVERRGPMEGASTGAELEAFLAEREACA
jgi:sugar/nucleoside kinase (ribokinase family)